MSDSVLFSFSLLSAITLALVYHPILAKLSVGLVSSYAKADVRKRAFAAMADGLLAAIALFYYRSWGSPLYLLAGAAYLLLRDAVAGRSVGKFLFGLVVVNLETGRPCGWRASISRNVLLPLPGANVVAAFLEASTIVRDPQGQRLGDRFALTQVVEGFGAKDLVTGVQQSLLDLVEQLGDKVRKPSRVPLKVQHRIEIRLAAPLTKTSANSPRIRVVQAAWWDLVPEFVRHPRMDAGKRTHSYPDAETGLRHWIKAVETAGRKNFADVRQLLLPTFGGVAT